VEDCIILLTLINTYWEFLQEIYERSASNGKHREIK
jgi:hypothetical protein